MIPLRTLLFTALLLVSTLYHLIRRPPFLRQKEAPLNTSIHPSVPVVTVAPILRRTASQPGVTVHYVDPLARRIRRCRKNCEPPLEPEPHPVPF